MSREAELRSRGLLILSLDDCRFSLEAVGRKLGTGSLEGRGIPDGLELGEWSMVDCECARGQVGCSKTEHTVWGMQVEDAESIMMVEE